MKSVFCAFFFFWFGSVWFGFVLIWKENFHFVSESGMGSRKKDILLKFLEVFNF